MVHRVNGIFATPRPVPSRKWPALAATVLIALALPVYLVAGWPISAWSLAAVLWVAGELFAFALGRLPLGVDNLATSGMVAIGMTVRVIAVMVVLIAVTVADRRLGVAAALLYVAAYTVELLVSLVTYFGGSTR
jgi:hypothetical protein